MITDLPYIEKTWKNLYHIYCKNKDIIGMKGLLNIYVSATLKHMICQIEYLRENEILDDPTDFLLDVKKSYEKLLEMI